MAALSALDVDNVIVEVDGPEVPIMDGSALPFVQLLDRAGRRTPGHSSPLHRGSSRRSRWATAPSARR